MKRTKDDAARIQAAVDADLKRTTAQRDERLDTVWGWKRNKGFDLATKGELERLAAASEDAERAVYQCEIIERAYHEHKRTNLTAADWREIVDAVRYAGYDATGHEETPDLKWLVDSVLARAQCQCEANVDAALSVRNAIVKRIRDDETDKAALGKLSGIAEAVRVVGNGVDWLVADQRGKMKQNAERGKENQAKGNTEEADRAARDMKTALDRVHNRVKKGATNVLQECRDVCDHFTPLTGKKNALGKFTECVPLTGKDGEPIQPETLAKNYRARFGTKKSRKAKPKPRTK